MKLCHIRRHMLALLVLVFMACGLTACGGAAVTIATPAPPPTASINLASAMFHPGTFTFCSSNGSGTLVATMVNTLDTSSGLPVYTQTNWGPNATTKNVDRYIATQPTGGLTWLSSDLTDMSGNLIARQEATGPQIVFPVSVSVGTPITVTTPGLGTPTPTYYTYAWGQAVNGVVSYVTTGQFTDSNTFIFDGTNLTRPESYRDPAKPPFDLTYVYNANGPTNIGASLCK